MNMGMITGSSTPNTISRVRDTAVEAALPSACKNMKVPLLIVATAAPIMPQRKP